MSLTFSIGALDITMTLSMITLSIRTLRIRTLSIRTFSITSMSINKLNITTLSKRTLSLTTLSKTVKNVKHHKQHSASNVFILSFIMLSIGSAESCIFIVMLSIVMLNVGMMSVFLLCLEAKGGVEILTKLDSQPCLQTLQLFTGKEKITQKKALEYWTQIII
jgi:hypothetical protein